MSARALKRLQGRKGVDNLNIIVNEKDEEKSSDEDPSFERPSDFFAVPKNAFALLGDDEEDNDDELNEVDTITEKTKSLSLDKKEGEEDELVLRKEEEISSESLRKESGGDGVKKKCKKQKKKKKGKNGSEVNNKLFSNNEDEDEIDRGIREVNDLYGYVPQKENRGNDDENENLLKLDSNSLLCVELRNLKPENEVRRKFGGYAARGEKRRNNHKRVIQRSHWLVIPRPSWHPLNRTGISMKCLGKKGNCNYFLFEHSAHYQKIQFQFFDAVESLDHNNIVALLNAHQYHVDSLLQLSEICKISEDFQTAAELIEKALYVLESGFHPLFNVTQGNTRLEYKRKENRPFFLALFRHIHFVANRACYVTALEFCKLVLSLSPDDDPLGIILMIDYYALKAEKYEFLMKFYEEKCCEDDGIIHLLPNFAYSTAMALFFSKGHENPDADSKLQEALLTFPSTVLPLMDRCGITLDKEISEHNFFDRTKEIRNPVGLKVLSQLFISRNYSLWKQAEVLDWFTRNCKEVLKQVEADHSIGTRQEAVNQEHEFYKSVHRPIDRHAILSEYKEAITLLPPHIKCQSMMTLDPLPPSDSVAAYTRPNSGVRSGNESGIMSLFLRSLLPSFEEDSSHRRNDTPGPQRAYAPNPNGAERPGTMNLANQLQEGAHALAGALRQLLDTMTYRGDLDENRQGQQDDEDDQWDEDPDHVY